MREPAGIFLFIDQDVVGLPCPEAMAPDLHRAMIVVEFDVEERTRIDAPYHRAVGFLHAVVTVRTCRPVAHANGKILRALDVAAPGLKPVIRRMPGAAELEVVVLPRKLVAVENDFSLAAVARAAPEQFVLATLTEF